MKLNIKRLESERERRKLSREEFSRLLGLHWTTYGKIVKNESTTLKTITSIAAILKVKEKALVA